MLPAVYAVKDILFDDDSCRQFLIDNNVFYESLTCAGCQSQMTRRLDRFTFQCPKKQCRKEFSMRKHTFFFGSMLKCSEILYLAYLWLNRVSTSSAITMTGHSPNTVSAFYSHFRKLVAASLNEEAQVIGGPGTIVEVDETKMGKRKYNRGHRVEGAWVVAGIERTEERRVFLVRVDERSRETLVDIISRHVAPGSVVHTDCWRGYLDLEEFVEIEHRSVNHSIGFKDYETGVHTNYIEGTNNALKIRISPRCRTKDLIDEHLLEFIWRRNNQKELWNSFISALREIHYDLE
jgi:transposase-like protein